jgi:hypothetical protein
MKIAGCNAAREFPAYLAVRELAHAAIKHRSENGSLILNGGTLEDMFLCVGGRLLRGILWLLLVFLNPILRLRNDAIRLMAELFRQFVVPPQHFFL